MTLFKIKKPGLGRGYVEVDISGAATDHGALLGLADDDHTRYVESPHDHSGDVRDGGTFDAANLTSDVADDGTVLMADGAGGAAWESVVGESEATGVYVMSAFREDDAGKLYICISGDGKDFKLVGSGSRYTSPTGTLRDPSIIFYDETWWICYTDDPTPIFRVIKSTDLLTWTAVANVDCSGVAGSVHVWAPEWFLDSDGSLHVIVAVGPADMLNNAKLYEVHPTNAALTAWSALTELSGIPAGSIDGYVVKIDSTYYCWYKDDSETEINWASASALTGVYTVNGWVPAWAATYEGLTLIKIDEATWRIYLDDFVGIGVVGNGIFWAESTDRWLTWTVPVIITAPYTFNHPTIYIAQGQAELLALRAYLSTLDHGGLQGLTDDDHTQYQLESEKGVANGYAGLDAGAKVPTAQLGGAGADNTKYLRGDQSWQVPAGGGDVATDAIWDAKGDLAAGTGANTAARVAVGTDGKYLKADSGAATGVSWDTPAGTAGAVKGAAVARTSNQALTGGVGAAISWNSEVFDDNNFYAAGSPTRITIPAAGWYSFACHCDFSSGVAQAYHIIDYKLNNTTWLNHASAYGWGADLKLTSPLIYKLAAGDYIEVIAYVSGNCNITYARLQVIGPLAGL